jgi:hypothetical protein
MLQSVPAHFWFAAGQQVGRVWSESHALGYAYDIGGAAWIRINQIMTCE